MAAPEHSEPVIVSEQGTALVITINRIKAGNSLDLEAATGMRNALAACRGRRDLRGIIITGAGDRFFCAGGDLKAYRSLSTPDQLSAVFSYVRDVLDEVESHELLTIAAINGHALGGGAELALACDLRIAAPSATFGFPQAKLGIIPGWNGVERLVGRIGRSAALQLLLAGTQLQAQEAQARGLVDLVADEGGALHAALAYLESVTVAPLTIPAIKKAVDAAAQKPPDEARAISAALFEQLWFTEDHREAEKAFAEKRLPVFVGN